MIIRGNEPIIIIRHTETGTDAYGNPEKSTQEILIRDGLFSYGSTNEPSLVDRDPVDAQLTLYLPNGTEIREDDIFEIRGVEWVKDGTPQEWPQLWPGFAPDVVVQVRKRRG